MLQAVLDSVPMSADTCAELLGVDRKLFADWSSGRRPVPDSYLRSLATMLGVSVAELRQSSRGGASDADRTPAIWFKLRDDRLQTRDREYVALVRRLASLVDQLDQALGATSLVWETVFESIRKKTDSEAPPREQGRQAAVMLRAARGLAQGSAPIGDVLRGNLRTAGVLVVETPLPGSRLEGCSFYVTSSSDTQRPCIFANSYGTTWFRRNAILAHEVAHLIFDAPTAGPSVDFKSDSDPSAGLDVGEVRAEAFAQEMLLPATVLRHWSQRRGVRWEALTAGPMAQLMADTHAEQRTIAKAARDAGLLDAAGYDAAVSLDVSGELPLLTEHAVSGLEYFRTRPEMRRWLDNRITTHPSLPLRLPVGYVKAVVEAVKSSVIAWGKGAELLMIDRHTFERRFGDAIPSE